MATRVFHVNNAAPAQATHADALVPPVAGVTSGCRDTYAPQQRPRGAAFARACGRHCGSDVRHICVTGVRAAHLARSERRISKLVRGGEHGNTENDENGGTLTPNNDCMAIHGLLPITYRAHILIAICRIRQLQLACPCTYMCYTRTHFAKWRGRQGCVRPGDGIVGGVGIKIRPGFCILAPELFQA